MTYKAFGKTLLSLWGNNYFSNKTIIDESGMRRMILRNHMDGAEEILRNMWMKMISRSTELVPQVKQENKGG